jgi:AIR synthase-related protein
MSINLMLENVKRKSGISQKGDIAAVSEILSQQTLQPDHPNGDDCAVIKRNGLHQLLAIEGFMNQFVTRDPWFAGWCGVMVNVSDIAAMGGQADAVVNAIWTKNKDAMKPIMEGMVAASETYGVPIVGGHTHLKGKHQQLAVSVLGHAQSILSSFAAKPGQNLVVAIDLRGAFRKPFLNWNAATTAPAERLRADLQLLPKIADEGLAFAAKDISQAGLLGTILMMLESSSVGASIQLSAIPKPQDIGWEDWLCAFPSFGFILTTDDENLPKLLNAFEERHIATAKIGEINDSKQCWVIDGANSHLFWDLSESALTGMTSNHSQTMEGH